MRPFYKRIVSLLLLVWVALPTLGQPFRGYSNREYFRLPEFKNPAADTIPAKRIDLPVSLIVAFHILYPKGEKPTITEEQIKNQIQALNRDFGKPIPPDSVLAAHHFARLAADTEIQFSSKYIVNFVQTTLTDFSDLQAVKQPSKGGAAPLKGVVNVWVADLKTTAGYAQLPGYLPETDGIVLDKSYFLGATVNGIYSMGKTLTHLMGNFLGLIDLWGLEDCQDDGVSDTPLHSGPTLFKGSAISLCYSYFVEQMTSNFMDNSPDEILWMFTKGQKEKMLNELRTRRYDLITPTEVQTFRNYSNREYFRLPEFKNPPIDTITPKKLDLPATLSLAFHIFYPKGEKPSISEEQIKKQIEALNRDFGKPTPPDSALAAHHFARLASDPQIQFCSKYSVSYIETSLNDFTDLQAIKQPDKGGVAPQKGVVNIWVADLKTTAGYAQLPGYSPNTDGIVLDKSYFFGQPARGDKQRLYSMGKTLTHLMGNFLGLIDLWGLESCQDDGISDTPRHSGPSLFKASTFSLCYSYLAEQMTSNFMDNSPDEILWMFTKGQKEKMLNELRTRRYDLITSSLCR